MKEEYKTTEFWWRKLLPIITILIASYLMIQYQLANHITVLTSDRWIHFYRFYDAAMQIKTGNFSYFQSNYGFFQSGRIFNALYGPLFAYLNGALILLCGSWYKYSVLTIFIGLMIAGLGMFYLLRKVKVNYLLSLILTVLYLQVGCVPGILRFNFMSLGAILAPYVIVQAVNMIEDPAKPIHWLTLGIVMSLVAQVHVLSTLVLTLTLIPFAIYGFIKTKVKGKMVLDLLKAIGVAIVLTANIWGGFIVIYSKNKLSLPNSFSMYDYTLKFTRMNANGNIWSNNSIVGFVVILLAFQLLFVIFKRKVSALNTFSTWVTVGFFVIASKLLPWRKIEINFPNLARSFQFPYRLTIGAWVLAIMCIGLSLTYLYNSKPKLIKNTIVILLSLATMQALISVSANNLKMVESWANPHRSKINFSNYEEVSTYPSQVQYLLNTTNSGKVFKIIYHVEPDYYPTKVKISSHTIDSLYFKDVVKKSKNYHHSVSGDKLTLTWNAKKAGKRVLPLITYAQSQLTVNSKIRNHFKTNKINLPIIHSKKGKNKVTLIFKAPIWFWFLLWLTIISWVGVIIISSHRCFKKLQRRAIIQS